MRGFEVILAVVVVRGLECVRTKGNETEGVLTTEPPDECQVLLTLDACKEDNSLLIAKKQTVVNISLLYEGEHCRQFSQDERSFLADLGYVENCIYEVVPANDLHRSHLLHGALLRNVTSTCPETENLKIYGFRHLNVTDVLISNSGGESYISLNISWELCNPEELDADFHIKVKTNEVHSNETRCTYYISKIPQPESNYILIPSEAPNDLFDQKIRPDCAYDVFFEAELLFYVKTHAVPDCVSNKCNCYRFRPKPRILNVNYVANNQYLVEWDPGTITVDNITYTIERVEFNNVYNNANVIEITRFENNLDKNTSVVTMELSAGENYNLTGQFTNNFKCTKSVEFSFTEEDCAEFSESEHFFIVDFGSISSCVYQVVLANAVETFYLLNGTLLQTLETECPTTAKLQVKHDFRHLNVTNVLISDEGGRDFIALNISWEFCDRREPNDQFTVSVHTNEVDFHETSCAYNDFDSPQPGVNYILTPSRPPYDDYEQQIQPDCVYDVFFENGYSYGKSHVVPDCVEYVCNCTKYPPRARILNVDHVYHKKYRVFWDPGSTTLDNTPYTIEQVKFSYVYSSNSRFEIGYFENNFTEHTSLVTVELPLGASYDIIGLFTNNFTCTESANFSFTVLVPDKGSLSSAVAAVIIFVVLLATVVVLKLKKTKQLFRTAFSSERATQAHSQQDGEQLLRLEQSPIAMTVNQQYTSPESLPSAHDKFEFPRDKIIIKESIGEGAFGHVYSAKAIGLGGSEEGYRMVAVKTLSNGENITKEVKDDFIAEIEIFKKIGCHPNIVTLLGCCTLEAPYMLIMELVPCGDLKKYLLELRQQWEKEIRKQNQVFFPSIDACLNNTESTTASPVLRIPSRLPSTSESVSLSEFPMTPRLVDYDNALKRELDNTELQKFAFQIANGMQHLEEISITHRDLAARNILVNQHGNLKISDFGLSRNGPYINHKAKKLPLRWMALEAIVDQKFDSKSDVWSFGIVLWEIGTLGAFPYERVSDSYLQQFLQTGRRLSRPAICTDKMYEWMRKCWAANPDDRPTFKELVKELDLTRYKVYVDFSQLNPMYVFPPSEAGP